MSIPYKYGFDIVSIFVLFSNEQHLWNIAFTHMWLQVDNQYGK